jgi:plastocyanin domain-containing protein
MDKHTVIALVITAVLIGGALMFSVGSSSDKGSTGVGSATIVDGKQIIEINAKGGYSPRVVDAKAGIPTVIKMKTAGTFDCSASVVIPELSYQKFLDSTGTEEIEVPAEKAQGTMQGLCSMGMYNFEIRFQ